MERKGSEIASRNTARSKKRPTAPYQAFSDNLQREGAGSVTIRGYCLQTTWDSGRTEPDKTEISGNNKERDRASIY